MKKFLMVWICAVTVVVLALAVSAFWWISIRPAQIKSHCSQNNRGWSSQYYHLKYDECIHGNGL